MINSFSHMLPLWLSMCTKPKADHRDWESGGGIVATSLGVMQLAIDDCINLFKDLAGKAFKKRTGVELPILGKLILAHHHGKYKTSGLESVLKNIFGYDELFGAPVGNGFRSNLKVGVIATSSGRNTCLLTNYNRPPPEQKPGKVTDTQSDEEADDEDIDADSNRSIENNITNALAGGEKAENSSGISRPGTSDSRTSITQGLPKAGIYTDLPEVDPRTSSEKMHRQPTEVDQWDESSDTCEDKHTESADSRKHSYFSGLGSF